MKEKNFPNNNNPESLDELTKEVNQIIESLEKEKNLENSIEEYERSLVDELATKSEQQKFEEEAMKEIEEALLPPQRPRKKMKQQAREELRKWPQYGGKAKVDIKKKHF